MQETRKLRNIETVDSEGVLHIVEVMQDMRWVTPLNGPAVPVPRLWYQCGGIEVTQEESGFRAGHKLLRMAQPL